jgi:O-antigen/teichoic acid export membrane protein
VTILLGIWVSSQDVGIYSAASKIALLMSFVLQAVNIIAAPKFAVLWQQGDHSTFEKMAIYTRKISTIAALPLLGMFVFAPQVVMRIYGSDFEVGSSLLAILALGQFVNAATGSVGFMLIMSGHEAMFRRIISVSVLLNFSICVFFIPQIGVLGAAIASALSLSLQNILCIGAVRRHLGINMYQFMKYLPLKERC